MVVLPSRKEKDEPNALLHNQAGLPMQVRQSSVCAEHIQTVLCTPQRTALPTVCCFTGMKGEDAARWHQYMIPLTCPPLQEGALPSLF